MGMESISRVTAAQSYQANIAASQPAPVTNVETSDAVAQDKQTEVKSSQQSDNTGSSQTSDNSEKNAATMKDMSEINKIINRNTVAEFGYNEPTNRITIKIKDRDTDEVIREIPSEKALKMLEKAWEIAGILVDEKR
ncbi:MAG: flagellar protein FlaG [Lachnospira sp.]